MRIIKQKELLRVWQGSDYNLPVRSAVTFAEFYVLYEYLFNQKVYGGLKQALKKAEWISDINKIVEDYLKEQEREGECND